jgi:hypothetical protein
MGTLLIGSYVLLIMVISRIRPTIRDLEKAHMKFEKIEPRALFYRTSIELVDWSEPLRVDNELSNINSWREAYEKDEAALRPSIQDISSS